MVYSNARVIKLWSHDHIYNMIRVTENFVADVTGRNYDVIFFSKRSYFKMARVIEIASFDPSKKTRSVIFFQVTQLLF